MIANQILGNFKFVLFVDEVGIERKSPELLNKILLEHNVTSEIYNPEKQYQTKTAVILPPISKLELNHNEAQIFHVIQSLKINKNVTQIFGWATRKNLDNSRLLIPFLEHMSDVIVTINTRISLSILTKRKFGVVKLKNYHHDLTQGSLAIREMKPEEVKKNEETPAVNPESIGTFKIGEFKSSELEAKKNLKLPFELIDLPNSEQAKEEKGRIIYTHDEADDFDEEDDPDNDLIF